MRKILNRVLVPTNNDCFCDVFSIFVPWPAAVQGFNSRGRSYYVIKPSLILNS